MIKLKQGDMTKVLSKLEENSVDTIITDPPYGMNIVGKLWDKEVPSAEMWKHAYRVLKPGGFILAFSTPKLYHVLANNIEGAGFQCYDMIQWVMSYKMPRGGNIRSCHEPVFVGVKPGGKPKVNTDDNRIPWYKTPPKSVPTNGWKRQKFGDTSKETKYTGETVAPDARGRIPCNVIGETGNEVADKFFYTPRVSREERGKDNNHPTPKPVALMEHLVKLYSNEGDTILDPFMGSGSTGIACKTTDRNFIGVDLDKEYIKTARKRIKEWKVK